MLTLEGEPYIVHKKKNLYISFPDILESKERDKVFLVCRSANQHHPTHSILHFWVSEDKGVTWTQTHQFEMNMEKDGRVWNCPRLSYFPDGSLSIVCDTKDSTNEKKALFITYRLKSFDEGESFHPRTEDMSIYGMLPDHLVEFKNEYYIANHTNDTNNNTLLQLVNISKDQTRSWYDRVILARAYNKFYCEASLLNYYDEYLLAFIRDNTRGPRPLHIFISRNGREWQHNGEFPQCGHRPTVLFKQSHPKNKRMFMTYRDTDKMSVAFSTAALDSMGHCHDVETFEIERERSKSNLFHFGYTGVVEYDTNRFLVAYYITKSAGYPYIKVARVKWKPDTDE